MSPAFRAEFARNELPAFIRKYGYLKRVLEDRDENGEVVAFGAQSAAVERTCRTTGDAPGALPSLILKHVLAISTILHLEDLDICLPPLEEKIVLVDPGPVLGPAVRVLRSLLVERIKADRYTDLSGKLFGQMSEEWSSADRASAGVGNCSDGVYRICYPESVGGALVAELAPMLASEVLPKEAKLLEIAKSELAEDRNVLVFAWHAHCGLYERLAGLLERETGFKCPILDTNKVTAKKRDAWLAKEIVGKNRRMMLVNPAAVETGFNKLTHFSTVIWFQPPGCNPKSERQAKGRIRRPGQTKEQRIYWLVYQFTSQEMVRKLLLHKVAESLSVDGLDPTAALRASGVGEASGLSGYDIGRQLYRMVLEEQGETADV
jgi:hypothetical protein